MTIPFSVVLTFGRIILGLVMVHYGWPKIRDLNANARDFHTMGFRPSHFWGTIVAVNEFFGGLAMLSGTFAEPLPRLRPRRSVFR